MRGKIERLGSSMHTHKSSFENINNNVRAKQEPERKLELRNGKLNLAKRKTIELRKIRIKIDLNSIHNSEVDTKRESLNKDDEDIDIQIEDDDNSKLAIKKGRVRKSDSKVAKDRGKKKKSKSKLNNKKIAENHGITLVALIIIIIVLMILAGISIAMLTGNNSILKNAQTAKIETEVAELEEKVKLAIGGAFDYASDWFQATCFST